MSLTTEHPHIVKDQSVHGGEPVIKGTRTPIRAIAEQWKWGDTPDQILEHFPHLTLAEVFDSLSYYQDHLDEIEKHIQEHSRS